MLLNTIKSTNSNILVVISEPCDFTDDEFFRRVCVQCDVFWCSKSLDVQDLELDCWILCSDFGVTKVVLSWVGGGNAVGKVILDIICWNLAMLDCYSCGRENKTYTGLVDLQEGEGFSIRGEPHDIIAAKDFLLVDPIRDSVEEIWSTIFGDLSSSAILPDEQIVATNVSDGVANWCECSILDIYHMSVAISK